MKHLLLTTIAVMLLVGCGEEAVQEEEAIDWDDPETRPKIFAVAIHQSHLQQRGKVGKLLYYARDQQKPYTGWTRGTFGKKYKVPRMDQYKNGKRMTGVVWKWNGDKCPVTNLKDGNGVTVGYKANGKEVGRTHFKDGERVR